MCYKLEEKGGVIIDDKILQEYKNPKLIILESYTNHKTKILVKCKDCGYEWGMLPHNIKLGRGCPICSHNKQKTHEQFVAEMKEINEDIIILGTYINSQTKIKCQCKICGYIWEAKPTHLNQGHGCNNCRTSTGERIIRSYLHNHNIKFFQQYTCEDARGVKNGKLRFDFYVPEYNLIIEYQGEQHYRPSGYMGGKEKFDYQKANDVLKLQYIQNHNYNYLEISYKDNTIQKLNTYFKCVTTAGCV